MFVSLCVWVTFARWGDSQRPSAGSQSPGAAKPTAKLTRARMCAHGPALPALTQNIHTSTHTSTHTRALCSHSNAYPSSRHAKISHTPITHERVNYTLAHGRPIVSRRGTASSSLSLLLISCVFCACARAQVCACARAKTCTHSRARKCVCAPALTRACSTYCNLLFIVDQQIELVEVAVHEPCTVFAHRRVQRATCDHHAACNRRQVATGDKLQHTKSCYERANRKPASRSAIVSSCGGTAALTVFSES